MTDTDHRPTTREEDRTTTRNDERDESITERVLEVRIAEFDEFFEASSEALRAGLAGDPQPAGLAFETPQQLLRLFSAARHELLETIQTERPESMRELARLVERDPSAVHRDLDELAEYGIVEFEECGRAKRPVLGYDEIHVEVDLTFGTKTADGAGAADGEAPADHEA